MRPLASVLILFLCLAGARAQLAGVTLPPDSRPVKVKTGFYLLNLNGLDEKSETFSADIYLSFQWKDSRLVFSGTEPQIFLQEAVTEKFREIWWPQIEYVNSEGPAITNEALEISPDGTVDYYVGLSGTFRADLDLRRFPFDQQSLAIRLGSFYWTSDKVAFEQEEGRLGFERANSYEGLRLLGVRSEVKPAAFQVWGDDFSEYHGSIQVKRNYLFYLWTIFGPVALIFFISCTVFYVPISQFGDRIAICLTGLLACIATQFAINFGLPQIGYLTIIDRVFIITYFCVALNVFISVWELRGLQGAEEPCRRIDRLGRRSIPLLYALLIAVAVFL